jgi:hypothetical protein
MSAFLCSPEHIGRLAAFAAEQNGDHMTDIIRTEAAEILARSNINSVGDRYGGESDDKTVSEWTDIETTAEFVRLCQDQARKPSSLKPVDAYKMAACSNYQSCEPDDYDGSVASRLLDAIRHRAAVAAFGAEAYENAPWDFQVAT